MAATAEARGAARGEELLDGTGLTSEDLRRLGLHFSQRWAFEYLRRDAASEFVAGAVDAVKSLDRERPDANPKYCIIQGGKWRLGTFLREEQQQRRRGLGRDAPTPRTVSLNRREPGEAGEAERSALEGRLADESAAMPDEALERADLAVVVRAAVAGLPARERAVVELVDLREVPVAEAARRMGLSRQRVYQLRERALPKLRGALRLAGLA